MSNHHSWKCYNLSLNFFLDKLPTFAVGAAPEASIAITGAAAFATSSLPEPARKVLLTVIPLQLFAYYVALAKKCDIDKPRNLGSGETGGHAALPMWINYMRKALEGVPESFPKAPEGLIRIQPAGATTEEMIYKENLPAVPVDAPVEATPSTPADEAPSAAPAAAPETAPAPALPPSTG